MNENERNEKQMKWKVQYQSAANRLMFDFLFQSNQKQTNKKVKKEKQKVKFTIMKILAGFLFSLGTISVDWLPN